MGFVEAAQRGGGHAGMGVGVGVHPGLQPSSPTSTRPIALEFLDRYPTAQSAASLGEKRMAAFMARQSYTGRRSARELVERPRGAALSTAGELEAEAKGECVRSLVAILRAMVAQLATLTAAIEHAVDAHPDGKVVPHCSAAAGSALHSSSQKSAMTADASCPASKSSRARRVGLAHALLVTCAD
jgi:hypothetical protein